MSSQIIAIRQTFDIHPLQMQTGYPKEGFEREQKLEKVLKSYQTAIVLLQGALDVFSQKQCRQTAQDVLSRVKNVKEARVLFDFLGLLSVGAKRALACHDEAVLQAEAIAVQDGIDVQASTPFRDSAQMERAIDLQAIYNKLKTSDAFCLRFCEASTKELEECYALYKHAYSKGDQSQLGAMNRVARTIHIFNELRDKIGNNWAFHLAYLPPHLWEKARQPLQHWDERFEPLMRFYLAIPDEQGLRESANTFVRRFMEIDASSSVPLTLLHYAYEHVSTHAFSSGKEGEEEDLADYRKKVLEKLLLLLDFAKEPLVLPDISKVPAALKVNIHACNTPRLVLLQFAHETNKRVDYRLEWQIDRCIAEFRKDQLLRLVKVLSCAKRIALDEEAFQTTITYLSRRFGKLFRLILEPQEEPLFKPELVYAFFTKMTASSMKNYLYAGYPDSGETKMSEKMLVDHLQTFANGPAGATFIRLLSSHKGAEEYFEGSDSQKLSEKGARALLYATGYLNQEKAAGAFRSAQSFKP